MTATRKPVPAVASTVAPSARDARTESRLTPQAFRRRVKDAGWQLADVAYRWGVTENYLFRVIANPDRAAHWDDAVRGLPNVLPADLRQFKRYRMANPLPKVPTRAKRARRAPALDDAKLPAKTGPEYAYVGFVEVGDVFLVTEDMAGHGVYEGEEGVVMAIDEDEKGMHYQIDFSGASLWLRSQDISRYLVETGRSRPVPIGQGGSGDE